MEAKDVATLLAKAIVVCMKRSGRKSPRIDPDTRIIDGIDGFDSLCGIETTIDLEVQLDIDLGDNIFIKEVNGRPRARTFREVVSAIVGILGGRRGRAQE